MGNIDLRTAKKCDAGLIYDFVRQLAEYEDAADEVVCSEEDFSRELFENERAKVILANVDGKDVGMALYFHNFSTWLGRPGIYIEELFVLPEYRGRGIGKALLKKIAMTASSEGCGRIEWSCLKSNIPAIGFYRSMGAKPLEEWTVFRLDRDKTEDLI